MTKIGTTFHELECEHPSLRDNLRRILENSVSKANILLSWYPAAKKANPGYSMVISNLVHIFLWAGDLAAILLAGMNSVQSGNALSRVLAVHLYDTSMNLVPAMLGRDFREAYFQLPGAVKSKREFNQVHSSLMTFKGKNRAFLQRVRNVSFAHRDKSIETLVREISSFPEEKVIPLSVDYLMLLKSLMTILGEQLVDPQNLKHLDAK